MSPSLLIDIPLLKKEHVTLVHEKVIIGKKLHFVPVLPF